MIVQRAPDLVANWSLAFFEGYSYRFARFVPGRFKHVVAFGCSEACRTWVVYDVAWASTRIHVLPDGPWGEATLKSWLEGATIVRPKLRVEPAFGLSRLLPFYCVPAVARLLGRRCGAAVTPTAFYRRLIAEEAVVDVRPAARRARPA